jgi:hypothetical protein
MERGHQVGMVGRGVPPTDCPILRGRKLVLHGKYKCSSQEKHIVMHIHISMLLYSVDISFLFRSHTILSHEPVYSYSFIIAYTPHFLSPTKGPFVMLLVSLLT